MLFLMPNLDWISLDGEVTPSVQFPFTLDNRAFLYGDQCFESIKVDQGRPLFWELHLLRLQKSTTLLAYEVELEKIYGWVMALIQKLELKNGKLKILVFRQDGGLYTPKSPKSQVLILAQEDDTHYGNTQEGLNIGLYDQQVKPIHAFSFFKSSQSFIYILASLYKQKMGWDEVLILNDQQHICEASSSNLFIWKDDRWITPAITQGCIDGIFRGALLQYMQEHQMAFQEDIITQEDFNLAEEAFLCNSQKGMRWIEKTPKKTYQNARYAKLANMFYKTLSDNPFWE